MCQATYCQANCSPAFLPTFLPTAARLNADMDVQFATMGAGSLHLLPLPQLLSTLKTVCPAADSYSAAPAPLASAAGSTSGAKGGGAAATAGSSCGSNALSLAAYNRFVESFPGPLSSNSNKDKVLKFLKDRLANCVLEEGLTDAPSWQVRWLACAHTHRVLCCTLRAVCIYTSCQARTGKSLWMTFGINEAWF